MTWLLSMKAKLLAGLATISALIAAIGYAWLRGRSEGATSEKQKADARQAEQQVADAQAVQHQVEARHDVESETDRLPDAPAQRVGDADPGTAAGRLRDDGWTRD